MSFSVLLIASCLLDQHPMFDYLQDGVSGEFILVPQGLNGPQGQVNVNLSFPRISHISEKSLICQV